MASGRRPEEWIGTKVGFDLKQDGDWTIVLFKHQGWREAAEFMHHCSTKWGLSDEPKVASRDRERCPRPNDHRSTTGTKPKRKDDRPPQKTEIIHAKAGPRATLIDSFSVPRS